MADEKLKDRVEEHRNKVRGLSSIEAKYYMDDTRDLLSALDEARGHPTPPVGAVVKCLVCAYDKPWGVWSETTGAAVCVECRDARTELGQLKRQLVDAEMRRAALENDLRSLREDLWAIRPESPRS